MIRRQVGNEYWLITQDDHAHLSGELARHVGNKLFDPLPANAIHGIALHDCGWPLHDDAPTLNGKGQPIDVFESTPDISLRVWQAAVDRTLATGDDYAALLVSLHVLALSVSASSAPPPKQHDTFLTGNPKTRFEMNRFQHLQIEIQERLRSKLGLPVDVPMRHGLVEDAKTQAELELQFHFRMLQALDIISLALCCTNAPANSIPHVMPRAGARPLTVKVVRDGITLSVAPWMFGASALDLAVSYRAVPARSYSSIDEFRATHSDSTVKSLQLAVCAG